MERLTKRLSSGASTYNYPKSCYFDDNSGPDKIAQSAFRQRCVERLADYEDSGLTPELVRETAELAIWVHENGLEKIKEWIKADKAGRLVVVHGRWEYDLPTINTYGQLRCSICNWWTLDPSVDSSYSYCPNCGAKMDGGDSNAVD